MSTLVLVGSGEFTPLMEETDRYLVFLTKKKKPLIAILPTAAGQEKTPQQWITDGVLHFKNLGATSIGIPVLEKVDTANPLFLNDIKRADLIYFSGGDPGYLFHTLENTPLWNLIYNKYQTGTILTGSSAGAMIIGEFVLSNAQQLGESKQKPLWEKAFNLFPYSILPHYDLILKEYKDVFMNAIHNSPQEVQDKWVGIDENTALVITQNKHVQILGRGRVYLIQNGKQTIYKAGSSFLLR